MDYEIFYICLADSNPTAVIGYTKRAAVYVQQKKFTEAEKDFNKALQIDPKYIQGYLQQGSLFRQICRYALLYIKFLVPLHI